MKKLIIISAVVLLASCGEKKDKAKSDGGNGDSTTANSATSSSSGTWGKADQTAFMDNCVPGAAQGMDSLTAVSYCDCMLDKIMEKYPKAEDALNMDMSGMMDMAQDCLK